MASKKKKLGEWKVKKTSGNEVVVTLPEGMSITGKSFTIEDLLEAIQRHRTLKEGSVGGSGDEVVVKCCGGNTAIA